MVYYIALQAAFREKPRNQKTQTQSPVFLQQLELSIYFIITMVYGDLSWNHGLPFV